MTFSRSRRICLLVIVGACSFLPGCTASAPKQKLVEAPPAPVASPSETQLQAQAPAQADKPPQMAKLPPPELNKVQEAVNRVFKDRALIDTSSKPNFIAGDFNGDLSEDIAVVLKPASGKLSEINEEFPPWILKDPFTAGEPGVPRPSVAEDEVLLAVIHGYGPNGWTDPEATQTYLLKNAVGSEMKAQPGKEFLTANRGKKLPRVNGDLIGEVLKGTTGYLYFGAGTYSWYDPKTFKGEFRQGMVHSGSRDRMKK